MLYPLVGYLVVPIVQIAADFAAFFLQFFFDRLPRAVRIDLFDFDAVGIRIAVVVFEIDGVFIEIEMRGHRFPGFDFRAADADEIAGARTVLRIESEINARRFSVGARSKSDRFTVGRDGRR